MVTKGTWVEIEQIVLKPEERAPSLPEDTKKVPYVLRVAGFLSDDAEMGQTVRIRTRTFRSDDWRVGVPKSVLGEALTALGRCDEAEPLLREARRVLKDIPGLQAQEARANLARLAALQEARGRRPQAPALAAAAPR